jgi:hypothetical protein
MCVHTYVSMRVKCCARCGVAPPVSAQELSGSTLEEVWALAIGAASAANNAGASAGEASSALSFGDGGLLDVARLSQQPLTYRQVQQAVRIAVAMARRESVISSNISSNLSSNMSNSSTGRAAPSPSSTCRSGTEGCLRGSQSAWVLKQQHLETALLSVRPLAPMGPGEEGAGLEVKSEVRLRAQPRTLT